MSETLPLKIAIGGRIRAHFHPARPWMSFSEGVVRRVDVTTPEGRFFVLEVEREVILDQEHRIRPGFLDYIRYECRGDFPGRIEILSTAEQDLERNRTPGLQLEEPSEEPKHEADEQRLNDVDVHAQPDIEGVPEPETSSEPALIDVEPQPVLEQAGLLYAVVEKRR